MSSEKKLITLKSSDGESFEVEEAVAFEMVTIKNMVEDIGAEVPIPIANVTGFILGKVVDYCRKHVEGIEYSKKDKIAEFVRPGGPSPLQKWDAEFVNVEPEVLIAIILAANYLDIKGLIDLTFKTVADMIRGKTTEEIRKFFSIVNDYTPEEEEEVRRETAWAFDDMEGESVPARESVSVPEGESVGI